MRTARCGTRFCRLGRGSRVCSRGGPRCGEEAAWGVISCRSRAPPTCRTRCCGRSRCPPSTTAGPSSRPSGAGCSRRSSRCSARQDRSSSSRRPGTGAWEAALVNTLSPGDRVLCFETGHFATLWQEMARSLGLEVDFVPGDWRHGVDPADGRATTAGRRRTRDQGRLRRAQRDVDGGDEPDRRGPCRDRRRRPPGAAPRRHHLLARLHRLPARRVEGRRHGRRLAEGADAPARHELQRGERQGAGGLPHGRRCADRSGTGTRS